MTHPMDGRMQEFQTDLQEYITGLEQEEHGLWHQAEVAFQMAGRYGRHTATWIASETGKSSSYIRQQIATAKAFPHPEDRAQDLSFTHHRYAAMTTDPAGWLDRATAEGWSTDQLLQAIQDAKDELAEAERCRRAQEKLQRLVDQFNEEFSMLAGRRAQLVWQTVRAARAS